MAVVLVLVRVLVLVLVLVPVLVAVVVVVANEIISCNEPPDVGCEVASQQVHAHRAPTAEISLQATKLKFPSLSPLLTLSFHFSASLIPVSFPSHFPLLPLMLPLVRISP
jgi:hypothetical protein